MELIVRIKEQEAAVVRGESRKFTIVGFRLASGGEEFFAELVSEGEVQVQQYSNDYYYIAYITLTVRDYIDKNNVKRYENRIRLNRLVIL